MNKYLCIFSLSLISLISFCYAEENPINSQVLSNGSTDDAKIQEQLQNAQKEILSQGPSFGLVGKIERGTNTKFSVNGEDFAVDDKAKIYGELRLGSTGEITGRIVDGNKKIAENIVIAEPQRQTTEDSNTTGEFLR